MTNKENIYKKYIAKLESSEKENYHFESAWISYVLLEDRLVSILRSSGGTTFPNGNPIKMMGPKIREIKIRMSSNQKLKGQLEAANLILRLEEWKDKRNVLMHSMADGSLNVEQIEKDITLLAINGAKLIRNFASAARRIKNNTLQHL